MTTHDERRLSLKDGLERAEQARILLEMRRQQRAFKSRLAVVEDAESDGRATLERLWFDVLRREAPDFYADDVARAEGRVRRLSIEAETVKESAMRERQLRGSWEVLASTEFQSRSDVAQREGTERHAAARLEMAERVAQLRREAAIRDAEWRAQCDRVASSETSRRDAIERMQETYLASFTSAYRSGLTRLAAQIPSTTEKSFHAQTPAAPRAGGYDAPVLRTTDARPPPVERSTPQRGTSLPSPMREGRGSGAGGGGVDPRELAALVIAAESQSALAMAQMEKDTLLRDMIAHENDRQWSLLLERQRFGRSVLEEKERADRETVERQRAEGERNFYRRIVETGIPQGSSRSRSRSRASSADTPARRRSGHSSGSWAREELHPYESDWKEERPPRPGARTAHVPRKVAVPRRPSVTDLRECGASEQHARRILLTRERTDREMIVRMCWRRLSKRGSTSGGIGNGGVATRGRSPLQRSHTAQVDPTAQSRRVDPNEGIDVSRVGKGVRASTPTEGRRKRVDYPRPWEASPWKPPPRMSRRDREQEAIEQHIRRMSKRDSRTSIDE